MLLVGRIVEWLYLLDDFELHSIQGHAVGACTIVRVLIGYIRLHRDIKVGNMVISRVARLDKRRKAVRVLVPAILRFGWRIVV